MKTFSERNGLVTVADAMVPGTVTSELRNKLWNAVDLGVQHKDMDKVTFALWHYLYKEPLDTRGERAGYDSTNWSKTWEYVRARFMTAPWYGVYDHIEILLAQKVLNEQFLNQIFADEQAAYRCLQGQIVQVTDEAELKEIEIAANSEG